MKVRGWLILGDEMASRGLPTSAALIGGHMQPNLPDAATIEPGRWIIWQPLPPTQPPLTLVCVELPLP